MAKFLGSAPPPLQDPIVGDRFLTDSWRAWFGVLPATLDSICNRRNTVSLTAQAASIGATDFSGGLVKAGLYRVSYYARITRAATTSSTLTVTLGWTDGGVAQNQAGTAMTGNTTATSQSGTCLIRSDAGAAITYTTTYGSVGATTMLYSLDSSIEQVKA